MTVEFSFDKLIQSLEQAAAWARGEDVPVRITRINADNTFEVLQEPDEKTDGK